VLLVFALLVAPAATARMLTPRVGLGLALSALIGVAITWLGLALAYFYGYPVGFYVTSVAFGLYVAVAAVRAARERRDVRGRALRPALERG
jgi:zinc/manganese transport system permease protein